MSVRTWRPQSLAAIIADVIDPTRTVYRGVSMRSRLEADFARHLDASGIPWRYEPTMFGGHGSGYLPDFELERPDGLCFVEVKPTLAEVRGAQRRMQVIWKTYPDAVLVVACAEESRYFAQATTGGTWESWVERWAHS